MWLSGAERAVEIFEKALDKFLYPIYVRHENVHNTLRAQVELLIKTSLCSDAEACSFN